MNLDDPARKIVGKRRPPRDSLMYAFTLQKTLNSLTKREGEGRGIRGVFRFSSHEEADEWMMKMVVRSRKD